LNGNLFLVYNHSLKRDKHNNMCVPNFLYSKNSHSNENVIYKKSKTRSLFIKKNKKIYII
ncbi:hypothetical protein FIM56_08015, partial [Helicobacter pylori]